MPWHTGCKVLTQERENYMNIWSKVSRTIIATSVFSILAVVSTNACFANDNACQSQLQGVSDLRQIRQVVGYLENIPTKMAPGWVITPQYLEYLAQVRQYIQTMGSRLDAHIAVLDNVNVNALKSTQVLQFDEYFEFLKSNPNDPNTEIIEDYSQRAGCKENATGGAVMYSCSTWKDGTNTALDGATLEGILKLSLQHIASYDPTTEQGRQQIRGYAKIVASDINSTILPDAMKTFRNTCGNSNAAKDMVSVSNGGDFEKDALCVKGVQGTPSNKTQSPGVIAI